MTLATREDCTALDRADTLRALRDVTRRKATEEQLREKQEQLTSVLRFAAAGQVASSMAHELNQPLYALATYIQACQVLASRPTGDRSQLAELMEKAGFTGKDLQWLRESHANRAAFGWDLTDEKARIDRLAAVLAERAAA